MLEVTDGDDLVVEDDGEDAPPLPSVKRACPNGAFRSVQPKPQLVYQMMPHHSYQQELEQPQQEQSQQEQPLQQNQVYQQQPQRIVVTIPAPARQRN